MSTSVPPIKILAEQVRVVIRTMKRGDILEHVQVEKVAGLSRATDENRYYNLMVLVNELTEEEQGITLGNIKDFGYKLLNVNEQIRERVRREERADRQLQRGLRSVQAIHPADMTATQKEERRFATSLLVMDRAQIADSLKQVRANQQRRAAQRQQPFSASPPTAASPTMSMSIDEISELYRKNWQDAGQNQNPRSPSSQPPGMPPDMPPGAMGFGIRPGRKPN